MPNKANFYHLSGNHLSRMEFCVKLCSQLWRKKNQQERGEIWILCTNFDVLEQIDELFWSYDQDSFIPHQILQHYAEYKSQHNTIIVSLAMPLPDWQGVVVNLSEYPLTQFKATTVVEIVSDEEKSKASARQRYNQYKKTNFQLKYHQISEKSSEN